MEEIDALLNHRIASISTKKKQSKGAFGADGELVHTKKGITYLLPSS
jgi:hypothetical protein